jgi:hypothetical protein
LQREFLQSGCGDDVVVAAVEDGACEESFLQIFKEASVWSDRLQCRLFSTLLWMSVSWMCESKKLSVGSGLVESMAGLLGFDVDCVRLKRIYVEFGLIESYVFKIYFFFK